LARKYERLAEEVEDSAESKFAAALARTFAAYEKSMPVPESLRQPADVAGLGCAGVDQSGGSAEGGAKAGSGAFEAVAGLRQGSGEIVRAVLPHFLNGFFRVRPSSSLHHPKSRSNYVWMKA